MKRTPIKRMTPLRRSSKPMRKVSRRRSGENREYSIVQMKYLRDHPYCEACAKVRPIEMHACDDGPRFALQLHHVRGRSNKLLNDARFFMAVCRPCHEWIHANGAAARELGLLAPISEFNVYPEEK